MQHISTATLKPRIQLTVYKGSGRSYIESHDILKDPDGNLVLGEAKPLTKQALRKLVELSSVTQNHSWKTETILSDNVLLLEMGSISHKMIWWTKEQKRLMNWKGKAPVEFICPPMLYFLSNSELKVFWMQKNSKPTMKTALFHCALPNVYDDGDVCMGNVKKPRAGSDFNKFIESWDHALWGSKYTRFLSNYELEAVLSGCIKSKSSYPKEKMVPLKKTIKQLWQ